MRWRRGDGLPDDARVDLGLRPRERVLAAARSTHDGWLAATDHALVAAGWRVEWSDVAHAQWLADEAVLALDPVPDTFPPRRLRVPEPGRLPEAVHERVMASIVVSRRVAVRGGFVRVVGRRAAEPSGALVWQTVPGAGVDLSDPDVRQAVDGLLASLRAELGGA